MTTPAAPSGEATSGNRLDALLPCPNGHDFAFSNVDADDPDSTSEPTFGVYCNCNCGWCVVGFHTQQEAINAWNSRATPAPESPNVARSSEVVAYRFRSTVKGSGGNWIYVEAGKELPDNNEWWEIEPLFAASQGAAQATEQKMRCGQCGAPVREAAEGSPFAYDYDPSADRSAKAVAPDAWQFLGSSPQSGITEPFPTGRWRECLDPKAAKDAGYEVRPLWTHPPAQPASPGPLQPGAGWVTESRVEAAFKAFDKAAPDAYEYGMDAIRAALEAALSADHDAKEVMLTTDDVPIQRRGVLCTICGKIVPELEAAAHCAAHWGQL